MTTTRTLLINRIQCPICNCIRTFSCRSHQWQIGVGSGNALMLTSVWTFSEHVSVVVHTMYWDFDGHQRIENMTLSAYILALYILALMHASNCIYIYMYVCMYVRVYVHVYVCIYVCICTHVFACIYTCICVYMYIYVCMYVHVYIYAFPFVATCVYVYHYHVQICYNHIYLNLGITVWYISPIHSSGARVVNRYQNVWTCNTPRSCLAGALTAPP